jgi:TolB-like protein
VNLSNDPEQEYFSDGISEEIMHSLQHIRDLKVAGRSSSFQFKGKNTDAREIGERLGVSTLLEGSVRKHGDRLRIHVELLNAKDGYTLWSERFERNATDVFAIQDEIALAITKKLKLTLIRKNFKPFSNRRIPNTEAYELYLKGRFHINKRGSSIIKGMEYFRQSIDTDPDFPLAHTGYADSILLAVFYGIMPPTKYIKEAKQSAEKAMELDPSLCEPYCTMGYYSCFARNWADTERYFKKSIEINPNYSQARCWYGQNYLAWIKGDFDEAEKQGLAAISIDTLNAGCFGIYGGILNAADKYRKSVNICTTGLELDPNSFLCLLFKGQAHLSLSEYTEALKTFEYLLEVSHRHCFVQGAVIATHCKMENFEKAHLLYEDLKQRSEKEYIVSTAIGISAAFLGHFDEAFYYFEKGLQENEPLLMTLKYSHWISEKLQEDERFKSLLLKIGFPGFSQRRKEDV